MLPGRVANSKVLAHDSRRRHSVCLSVQAAKAEMLQVA